MIRYSGEQCNFGEDKNSNKKTKTEMETKKLGRYTESMVLLWSIMLQEEQVLDFLHRARLRSKIFKIIKKAERKSARFLL